MGSFFAELRRRHIYRIGAGYVVVAWGIAQVIDFLSQVFALPAGVAQPVAIMLAIGLPITLIAAWMIVGAANETDSSADRLKAAATDWVLAGGLAVVIGLIGYQQLSPGSSEIATTTESERTAVTIADEIVEDIANRLPNSIAVLPFENVSPDPDDAYFAVGVHDAILTHLSKLQNVNVIGRTSVLQYPGSGKTIPEIADELNVEMVMEGSVRYAGDQVQVTARLLDGMTNNLIWTEPYDGDLSDIFGIQAEIAMNIANSLRADFSAAEQESIETPPTDSPEALLLYLKAIAVTRQGLAGGTEIGIARRSAVQNFLDDALALDPGFALAHLLKAVGYSWSANFTTVTEDNWLDFKSEIEQLVETNARMALELDPSLGSAHAALGSMHYRNRRKGEAQSEAEQALRLSPHDPAVLAFNARVQFYILDRPDEAIRSAARSVQLDPINFRTHDQLGRILHLAGRHDEAVEAFGECLRLDPSRTGCTRYLAASEFARDNREAALNTLRRVRFNGTVTTSAFVAHGLGLLEQPDEAQQEFEALREIAAEQYVDPVIWAWAYMGVGDYDEALNQLTIAAENPELIQTTFMTNFLERNFWSDPMLDQPKFVEVRNRLTLRQ